MSDLRFLLNLAGVRRRDLAAAIAAGALTLVAALSLTVLSGWLITRAWQMPPILDLGVAITAVRGLGITRAVFRYVDRLIGHRVALTAGTRLRAEVFRAVINDASGKAHTLPRGVALARLGTDADRVTDFLVRSVIPAGVASVVSVLALGAAVLLQPLAAVALAVGFLLTGVASPLLVAHSHRRSKAVASQDSFASALDDQLLHRAEFAVAGLSSQRIDTTHQASRDASTARVAAERPLATAQLLTRLGSAISTILILVIGLHWYSGDPTWLGMLVLLPLAAFESHGPLATAAIHTVDARDAAQRIRALLSSPSPTSGKIPDSLEIKAASLQLTRGDRTWDIDAPFGSRHRISGPSGIGKTSFLLTLGGLIPPESGTCTIGGLAIDQIDPTWLRTHIRVHPENEWIFATTIRENLLVGAPEASDRLLSDTLAAVGLTDFPLDTLLPTGADSLSSGQRRRLLLARALVSDAEVLLLDEPTEHIARDDASALLHMLLEEPLPGARPDRTVIVVTHAV